MTTFTIDAENNITAGAGISSAADESQSFTSQNELAKLAAGWPAARLVEIWNSFAGVAPFDNLQEVKKFTSRETAVKRIFKAVERLSGSADQPAPDTAPVKATAKKAPPKPKPRHAKRPRANTTAPRDGSKKAEVVDLMSRKSGASLDEIMTLTAWQAHTVRGFVSGTLIKKMGLKVESLRREEKGRFYRIVR